MNQELPILDTLDKIYPQMKRSLDAAKEKYQLLGPDIINITDLALQENMSTLSIITALTIDIHNSLCNWTKFQHQLAITTEATVEVCVQK